jgi:hypothetical protein
MALPASGQIDFGAIRAEYGKSGAFSLGDCAGLNGGLPSSATAQVSASTFYSARYGPEICTMTRGDFDFLGTHSYGYVNASFGSVDTRTVKETANQLVECFSTPNAGKSYIKITNHAQIWQLWHSLTNVWATKTWNATDGRYEWNTSWWNNTGTIALYYYFNG